MNGIYLRVLNALRDFRSAREGNVAITFGLCCLVLIGSVGTAVDYSRANRAQASIQAALDSAALMISKEASTETPSQLQANAQKYFAALFTNPDVQNVNVNVTYTNTNGSTLAVNATATLPTTFASVIGVNQVDLAAASTAKWGMTRLRVALVLDNTGSMAQSSKITALKSATNSLLTQIQKAVVNDGDAYVSIVPFVNAVNLGSVNYTASWIDWTDWNAVNGKCSSTKYTTKSSCVAAKKTWTPANHNTWNGCVTDRGLPITTGPDLPSAGNYDENVDPPVAGNLATPYPAYQAPSCPQAAMGLSYNWSAMTTEVNNMQPGGSTDQPIGLVWGWQTLAGGGPFTAPAMDPNYTYSQVIILLSDGLNTQDRWYGNGYSTSTQVDFRMYDQNGNGTCANIKAAGITIYTVQVNTDGSPTSTLLQDCASDPNKFFLLTSADEIVTTFNTIGTSLTQLYLSQ
jgi:Flp pilus assembly protein TadG